MSKASGYIFVKDGFFYARFRLPTGKDSRRKLGPAIVSGSRFYDDPDADGLTLQNAEAALAEILAPWRDWTDNSDPTFSQAAQEFIIQLRERGRRETTVMEYQRICLRVGSFLHQYGLRVDGQTRRLSQISELMMTNLREEMACVNQTKTVLAGIVKVARKKHKYTGPDFSEWFERVPVKRKLEVEVYTPAEVEKIASCAEPEIAAIIRVAAYTGLRMSELRALTWGDVDFAGEKITVRRRFTDTDGIQAPKSGKARTVPMASQVANTLRGHFYKNHRDHVAVSADLVFGIGRHGFRSYEWIYSGFVVACEHAEVRRLRFSDLRHVFGSTMVQRFPLTTVQEWMGHAAIQTTMRYVHHVPRGDDAAKMSDLLGGIDA